MAQRILVVEDDDLVRRVLVGALELAAVEVVDCRGCADAVEQFRSAPFDLAVLDINLGEQVDGIELAVMLRSLRPDLPVVFVSSAYDRRSQALSIGGAVRFIGKPWIYGELLSTIRSLLG